VNFGEEKRPEVISVVSKDVVFFHGGTNGSNPFRSSGESVANCQGGRPPRVVAP